jgi:hypothetical protein
VERLIAPSHLKLLSPRTPARRQVSDQQWLRGNLALRNNVRSGEPVRLIRGKVRGGARGWQ